MLHSMVEDQAAGLRRMLGKQATKSFVVLSAIPAIHKNNLMYNLASALSRMGNSTHLIDTRIDYSGVSSKVPQLLKNDLWDLSIHNKPINHGYYEFMQGGRVSHLAKLPTLEMINEPSNLECLSRTIQAFSEDSNIWLLDSDLNLDNPFLIPEFSESDVILVVSGSPNSIKNGYGQLKHIAHTVGRKKVALLVHQMDEDQAQLIYKNISNAAKNYLSIPLSYLGNIPNDEYLNKAQLLGKSIIDAFPLSKSANAFRDITELLTDQKLKQQQLVAQSSTPQSLVLEH